MFAGAVTIAQFKLEYAKSGRVERIARKSLKARNALYLIEGAFRPIPLGRAIARFSATIGDVLICMRES
jgi:hypothetical protein